MLNDRKSDSNVSCLRSGHSKLASDAFEAAIAGNESTNRKNKFTKEKVSYLPVRHIGKGVIISYESYLDTLHEKGDESHCKSALCRRNSCWNCRTEDNCRKFVQSKTKRKRTNANDDEPQ